MYYLIDVKTGQAINAYHTLEEYELDCKKYPHLINTTRIEELSDEPDMDEFCAPWLRFELVP